MADLTFGFHVKDAASAGFAIIASHLQQLKTFLVDFTKDSVRAYAETERGLKQLSRVAGENTAAFKEQASAMQKSLGVSDDMVIGLQTMLLRFGEAPEKVGATVKALLDYSAATGGDAVTAAHKLILQTEKGKKAFKELGLEYKLTGDASKDLEAATAALAKSVGGASDDEADTLYGRTKKFKEEVEDLKKQWGEFLVEMEHSYGVIDKVKEAFAGFVTLITGGDGKTKRDTESNSLRTELIKLNNTIDILKGKYGEEAAAAEIATAGENNINNALSRRLEILNRLAVLSAEGAKANAPISNAKGIVPSHKTGMKVKAGVTGGFEMPAIFANNEANREEELEREKWFQAQLTQEREKAFAARLKMEDEEDDKVLKKTQAFNRELIKEWERPISEAERVGLAIGQAFANALTSAIDQLATGGEMDVGETIGNILAAVLAVAGAAIGTVVGGPVGTVVGGTIGSLAGSGIKALTRRRHDGGTIERFHSGGWPGLGGDEVPIIAQRGEHMLSRGDVANMGGHAGVEQAKRGGGGLTINVGGALDAGSFREYLEGRGGRGVYLATMLGRGHMSGLLGG